MCVNECSTHNSTPKMPHLPKFIRFDDYELKGITTTNEVYSVRKISEWGSFFALIRVTPNIVHAFQSEEDEVGTYYVSNISIEVIQQGKGKQVPIDVFTEAIRATIEIY